MEWRNEEVEWAFEEEAAKAFQEKAEKVLDQMEEAVQMEVAERTVAVEDQKAAVALACQAVAD